MMKQSVYMTWAKHHAAAKYNLANSGILGCEASDLAFTLHDVMLNGPNHEGFAPLKAAIARRYGVNDDNVMIAQGTSMANFLTIATLLERGDEVLIEQPAYDPFLAAASYLGANIKRFARRFENGYQLNLDELQSLISERTKLIVLSNPHNPSGVNINTQSLAQVGDLAAAVGAFVLVDEVYRDILFEEAEPVAAHLGDHFITTSSLTKAYGLSGLRCGWILCEPNLAERMRRLNDLFGAVGSMPSDSLALAAFRQLDLLLERTRAIIEPNQYLIRNFLAAHEEFLDYVLPKHSMIVFPRLKHVDDSERLHNLLRQYETSIVPGKFFEEARHFRLGFAVKTADVEMGLSFLSKTLQQLHEK
ncbi:MAG TPA: pyridoxal phosphate-dependent aminotransferase [Blastocatellia bacterium]|nr:pyridoxal phosphate-dependent aminotransferase [Blastocatellia bacterium]